MLQGLDFCGSWIIPRLFFTDETWHHLVQGALLRIFLRSPAEKARSMTEALLGEIVVAHFAYEHRVHRFPLAALRG